MKFSIAGNQDTTIQTHETSIDPLARTSICKSQFGYFVAKSWDLQKRILQLNVMDLTTLEIETKTIKVPTNIKLLQCPTFCINDSFLLIQDDYELNWFLFKKVQNEYKYVEMVKLPARTMAFEARALENNKFLLMDIYNHNPKDSVYNTSLCIYDAVKRKTTHVIHPEVPCIGLSHFPHNWIGTSNHTIALAEPCGNKIQLFDLELKKIKNLSLPKKDTWVDLPNNKLPIETSPLKKQPKLLIDEYKDHLYDFSRIETLNFLNDSIMIIGYSNPNPMEHEQILLYNLNTNAFTASEKIKISPYNLVQNGFCLNFNEDNFIVDPNLSSQENENVKNQFYESNDPEFIIEISKIIVD